MVGPLSAKTLFVVMCALPMCLGILDSDCTAATFAACDPNLPAGYFECSSGTALKLDANSVPPNLPIFKQCPANQICSSDVLSTATPNTVLPCIPAPLCTDVGIFRYQTVCRTYFACVDIGEAKLHAVVRTCAAGMEFSTVTLKCEPTATAGCSVPRTTTPSPAPTPTVSATTPAVSVSASPATTAQPCYRGQRFPVATNCRRFEVCDSSGKRIARQCPFRLKFDEVLNICRLNSKCGSRPVIE